MSNRLAYFSAACALALGCEKNADLKSQEVGDAGQIASLSCHPGDALPCFCTDGAPRGTQLCSVQGQLAACLCPALDGGAVSSQPAPAAGPPPKGVCPGLTQLDSSCTATPYLSKELPSSMLFAIDRSRSMLCNLPPLQTSQACEAAPRPLDASKPTKWKVTQAALSSAFDTLPERNTLAALTFFSVDGACGAASVPNVALAALDSVQRSSLKAVIAGSQPDGQTPIVGATILAYAHLHQEAKAPGNRFVVLLTDGAESCTPEAIPRLLDVEVKKARDANIRTFVIGAPGSEQARALLSELAFRGGTATSPNCVHNIQGPADVGDCHLDMTKSNDFAAALAAALATVQNAAVGCEFSVPAGPGGPTQDVNVQYTASTGGTAECFAKDDSAPCDGGANGWQFAREESGAEDLTKVRICGSACERVHQDPQARIDVLVGCAPILLK